MGSCSAAGPSRPTLPYGLRSPPVYRSEIAARVAEMLELVALPGMADRRVDGLSGGQAQRVAHGCIGAARRACCCSTEPLAALDANLQGAAIRHHRDRRRHRRDPAIVTTTHDEAATMATASPSCARAVVVAADTATRVALPA